MPSSGSNVQSTRFVSASRGVTRMTKLTKPQGLWWGGERIWLEDLVRLNKSRGELPVDQFPMSPSSKDDNCVFLKVKCVASLCPL